MKTVKPKKAVDDILLRVKRDRRLLPNVPDPEGIRKSGDRRGSALETKRVLDFESYEQMLKNGIRYNVEGLTARITCKKRGK